MAMLGRRAAGRCLLTSVNDFASKPFGKVTVTELLDYADKSPKERTLLLHENLKVGLSRCAVRLSEAPFGFCNAQTVKKVSNVYVENLRHVLEFEHQHGFGEASPREYDQLTQNIFNQHKGTMLDVARGVFEFYEDLNNVFGPGVDVAELRNEFAAIKEIENSLDDFFTSRLTLRLLISHVQKLNEADARKSKVSLGNTDWTSDSAERIPMVGVVNTATEPIQILSNAFTAARFMCMRDFEIAPALLINGVPYDEYRMAAAESKQEHQFEYVHTHLFYIFFELLKNAARASVERRLADEERGVPFTDADLPPIRIVVHEDAEDWAQERSIRLTDEGTGMTRDVLSKSFCYFFSSVKQRPKVADDLFDFDKSAPIAGFGFGLPISRVMARYFAGDLDVHSIPGKGTDVYIYL